MKKYKTMHLFTNRQIMVFDHKGDQVSDMQILVSCCSIAEREHIVDLLDNVDLFYIASWKQWAHPITKQQMAFLLGIGYLEEESTQQSCNP